MAKFSDLPPEIAEEIVQWVEIITTERVNDEQEALLDLMAGAPPPAGAAQPHPAGRPGGIPPFPLRPPGAAAAPPGGAGGAGGPPAPAPAPPAGQNQANNMGLGGVNDNGNPLNTLFNMFAGALGAGRGGAPQGGPGGGQAQNNLAAQPPRPAAPTAAAANNNSNNNNNANANSNRDTRDPPTQRGPPPQPAAASPGQQQRPAPSIPFSGTTNRGPNPFAGMFTNPGRDAAPASRPLNGVPFTFGTANVLPSQPPPPATNGPPGNGNATPGHFSFSIDPVDRGNAQTQLPPIAPFPSGPSATPRPQDASPSTSPFALSGSKSNSPVDRTHNTGDEGKGKGREQDQPGSASKSAGRSKQATPFPANAAEIEFGLPSLDPKGKGKAKASAPAPANTTMSSQPQEVKPASATTSGQKSSTLSGPMSTSKTSASTQPPKKAAGGSGGGGFFADFGKQLKKGNHSMFGGSTPAKRKPSPNAGKPSTSAPQQNTSTGPTKTAPKPHPHSKVEPTLSDDDMPEPVPVSPPHSPKNKKLKKSSQKSTEDQDDSNGIPSLCARHRAAAMQSNTQSSSQAHTAAGDSDDDMPALEPLDRGQNSVPASKGSVSPEKVAEASGPGPWAPLSQLALLKDIKARRDKQQSLGTDGPEAGPSRQTTAAASPATLHSPPPLEPMSSDSDDEDLAEDDDSAASLTLEPPPLEAMSSDSDDDDDGPTAQDYPDADEDYRLPSTPFDWVPAPIPSLSHTPSLDTTDEDDPADDWETTEDEAEEPAPQGWVPTEADWRVDPETWSYPDGLPSDPILPLMLVSRAFLYAARRILYAKGVNINGPWPLHLFVRTLTSPQVRAFDQDDSFASRTTINTIVKSLNLHVACSGGGASVGRGSLGLIAEAIKLCPRVKTVNIRSDPLRSAWPVLEEALRTATDLESVSMRSGSDETYPMLFGTDRLSHLSQFWPNLKSIDILGLMAPPSNSPYMNIDMTRALTTVSLVSPTVGGKELRKLLKTSVGTLTTLKLIDPSNALTRGALGEILVEHAPYLTELVLNVNPDWHPRTSAAPPSASPELSQFFLHTVISKFKKLETLHFLGSLANSSLFSLMPSTLKKLSWGQCTAIEPRRVALQLSTLTKAGKSRLPNLQCVTVIEDDLKWTDEDFNAVQTQLNVRDACFHNSGPGLSLGGMEIPGGILGFGVGAGPPVP